MFPNAKGVRTTGFSRVILTVLSKSSTSETGKQNVYSELRYRRRYVSVPPTLASY